MTSEILLLEIDILLPKLDPGLSSNRYTNGTLVLNTLQGFRIGWVFVLNSTVSLLCWWTVKGERWKENKVDIWAAVSSLDPSP